MGNYIITFISRVIYHYFLLLVFELDFLSLDFTLKFDFLLGMALFIEHTTKYIHNHIFIHVEFLDLLL